MSKKWLLAIGASAILALGAAACGDDDGGDNGNNAAANGEAGNGEELSGTIRIDGSSTVAPLSEAAAELFMEENSGVRVTVGTSGTGGGFEKFCRGETDGSDASREIKEEEIELCEEGGIEYESITVGNDGLAIAIHPENDWATCVTVDELNAMWGPDSTAESWSDINPDWPDEPLELYGPGTDSGTFDYFTEAINGEEGASRSDYNNIGEDDSIGITGVSGSPNGLFYVGLSHVQEAGGQVVAAEVENPDTGECVAPSTETVQSGDYAPLGRPLFLYASDVALERPEVVAFFDFYIENAEPIAERALFIGLNDEQQADSQAKVDDLAGR